MDKNPVNIKVDKAIALTLSVYCKIHSIRMIDFTNKILSSQLKDFEEKLKEMRRLDCDK